MLLCNVFTVGMDTIIVIIWSQKTCEQSRAGELLVLFLSISWKMCTVVTAYIAHLSSQRSLSALENDVHVMMLPQKHA